LSRDLEQKLKNKIKNVPIEFLYHPVESTTNTFTLDKFTTNVDKKILSSGSWARKFLTIYLLKTPSNLRKVLIEPTALNIEKFKHLLDLEKSELNFKVDIDDSVELMKYQSTESYDKLLSENVVFMDFYDISASNLVLECIVRNTPILIKKHNAVIDYLGEDYPFYFESVEEASDKINDFSLIEKTHNYLVSLKTKQFLTGEYFLQSIKNGKIYSSL
jgi:hypothetical protein